MKEGVHIGWEIPCRASRASPIEELRLTREIPPSSARQSERYIGCGPGKWESVKNPSPLKTKRGGLRIVRQPRWLIKKTGIGICLCRAGKVPVLVIKDRNRNAIDEFFFIICAGRLLGSDYTGRANRRLTCN